MPTRMRVLTLLAVVPAAALAGCLADDAAPIQPQAAFAAPAAKPTEAILHVPGAAAAIDAATALPAGIPVPLGLARSVGHVGFEPTIGATSDGVLFMTNRDHSPPYSPLLFRSADKGLTWEDVTPRLPGGAVSFPPDTGDTYVHVDVETGRVFQSDLQSLMCSTLSYSDDKGDSWIMNPVGCGHPVGVHDHQTVFTAKPRTVVTAGYPNVVYYCINRIVDAACATSVNGGVTFGPLRPLVFGPDNPTGICGGLHAHGAAAPDGTVYLPAGRCGVPTVAITRDDGLTWDHATISDSVEANGHEVAMAVDESGNAYAFWIGNDLKPYLAASTDGGASWTEPIMVAPPGLGATSHPTIAAGADGRVAMAYLGTAADKAYDEMEDDDTWNAYVTIALDATSAAPTLATAPTNDPADPIGRGVCGGGRCYGNNGGGPGDFIDVIIDSEGRPWAAFVDSCTGGCIEGGENDEAIGFAGTLSVGPALRGELAPLPDLLDLAQAPPEADGSRPARLPAGLSVK